MDRQLSQKIIQSIKEVVFIPGYFTPIDFLCGILPKETNIYILGGAIRNIIIKLVHGYEPQTGDIDVIIDNVSQELDVSKFLTGEKIMPCDLNGIRWFPRNYPIPIDICLLPRFIIIETYRLEPTIENLLTSVDFNVNCVLYDVKKETFIERNCIESIRKKMIDFNTDRLFDVVVLVYRILLISFKTGFQISKNVFNFIKSSLGGDDLLRLKDILISKCGKQMAADVMQHYYNIIRCRTYMDYLHQT